MLVGVIGGVRRCADVPVGVAVRPVAVIVVEPVATLVARPWLPGALLIVAAAGFDELHETDEVTSCELLSLNVPVAVNCWP